MCRSRTTFFSGTCIERFSFATYGLPEMAAEFRGSAQVYLSTAQAKFITRNC